MDKLKIQILDVIGWVALAVGVFMIAWYVFESISNDSMAVNEISSIGDNLSDLMIKETYDIKGLNSIAYDGKDLWGLAGYPSYSGVQYDKRIVQINKDNGEKISECSINFTSRGIAFIGDFLWVTTWENQIYKISPQICAEKEECTGENDCIVDSLDTISGELWGLTSDGQYI